MQNKLSKIEIALTAIIFIIACFGMGMTVHKRVQKNSGELTTENYTEYMQVTCELGDGSGSGTTMSYTYYITVKASPHYKLENITIYYSLESDGADLSDGTLVATVDAGKSYSKKCEDKFNVKVNNDSLLGQWDDPTLEITVKSVTGTFSYSV